MAEKIWSDDAWDSYTKLQTDDKKMVKKINELLKDIERNGALKGKGNPEPLKGNWSGYCSRQINEKDRLIYKLVDGKLYIAQCKGHYFYAKSLKLPPSYTILPVLSHSI